MAHRKQTPTALKTATENQIIMSPSMAITSRPIWVLGKWPSNWLPQSSLTVDSKKRIDANAVGTSAKEIPRILSNYSLDFRISPRVVLFEARNIYCCRRPNIWPGSLCHLRLASCGLGARRLISGVRRGLAVYGLLRRNWLVVFDFFAPPLSLVYGSCCTPACLSGPLDRSDAPGLFETHDATISFDYELQISLKCYGDWRRSA